MFLAGALTILPSQSATQILVGRVVLGIANGRMYIQTF